MEIKIGKIESIRIGSGGYDDAMHGISFTFTGDGWGVGDFWGQWATSPTTGTKWTHAQRIEELGNIFWRLHEIMVQAKVSDAYKLKGIPVEVTFNDKGMIASWRILKECIL